MLHSGLYYTLSNMKSHLYKITHILVLMLLFSLKQEIMTYNQAWTETSQSKVLNNISCGKIRELTLLNTPKYETLFTNSTKKIKERFL